MQEFTSKNPRELQGNVIDRKLPSERRSWFFTQLFANQGIGMNELGRALWAAKKAKAQYVIDASNDQIIYGMDLELSDEEIIATEDMVAKNKEPYGDVTYADPGYKADKKKRYPIDTEEHIRAAFSYINQERNHKGYTSEQVSKIKSRIVSAWRRVINQSGPPSAA